mmetsp:Transcript_116754/g.330287  ORF Transcript_116754/g.330287 Transcript_116754/m.330287 type:complete len:239 (-) Transcript_116754:126-842(-)
MRRLPFPCLDLLSRRGRDRPKLCRTSIFLKLRSLLASGQIQMSARNWVVRARTGHPLFQRGPVVAPAVGRDQRIRQGGACKFTTEMFIRHGGFCCATLVGTFVFIVDLRSSSLRTTCFPMLNLGISMLGRFRDLHPRSPLALSAPSLPFAPPSAASGPPSRRLWADVGRGRGFLSERSRKLCHRGLRASRHWEGAGASHGEPLPEPRKRLGRQRSHCVKEPISPFISPWRQREIYING